MIIGLGLLNKDLVAVVPRWERDQKVEAIRYFEQVGGPVPVALAAMARLGTLSQPPVLFGVIGDDRDGSHLIDLLAEDGVDASQVIRAPGIATSKSLVLIDTRDGSRTLANYAVSLPPLILTDVHRERLSRATVLHLDGRDLPAALEAAQIVRRAGGIVSLDLGTMRPGRDILFPLCDIVIASQKGAAGAFPDIAGNPIAQARHFLEAGVRRMAGVTLGERGVVIAESGGEPVWLAARRVDAVVDTNGAGDTFHGAFLWASFEGRTAVEAAEFAQNEAANRIQRYGNRPE